MPRGYRQRRPGLRVNVLFRLTETRARWCVRSVRPRRVNVLVTPGATHDVAVPATSGAINKDVQRTMFPPNSSNVLTDWHVSVSALSRAAEVYCCRQDRSESACVCAWLPGHFGPLQDAILPKKKVGVCTNAFVRLPVCYLLSRVRCGLDVLAASTSRII